MTPEELLKPRYKVIADYPSNPFEVEQIIRMNPFGEGAYCDIYGHYTKGIDFFEQYPHLFKKLEWWEYRNEDDLPEHIRAGKIRKVIAYNFNVITPYCTVENSTLPWHLQTVLPATKKEYLEQQNHTQVIL